MRVAFLQRFCQSPRPGRAPRPTVRCVQARNGREHTSSICVMLVLLADQRRGCDAGRVHERRRTSVRRATARRDPVRRSGAVRDARPSEMGADMTVMESDIYYDPYDFEIDTDPYPVWKRLRDERPLYYNERYDFYALSRFDDVDRCSLDWETYVSSKGTVLELIKSGMELPPGSHHLRGPTRPPPAPPPALARVFTPRNINGLEPKIREFCARSLDPLVGARRLRLHRRPRRADAHAHHRHAAGHPRAGPGGHPRPHRRGPAADRERHARRRHHVRRRRDQAERVRGVHRVAGRATRRTT